LNKLKYFIAFIAIISIFITGCSNATKDEVQKIEVEKRIGNNDKYEDFKLIENKEQVQRARKLVQNIKWENAKVSMVRPPDYRFAFQYKNSETVAKAVLYELWISPNKDKIELVIDAESKYAQLDKKKSAELFEILTGGKLSELK